MVSLLAIGFEGDWLLDLVRCAERAGHHVIARTRVFDAWQSDDARASFAAVVVDAGCCDERTEPALLALRWRIPGRFVVAYGPGCEAAARRLNGDVVVAKASGAEAALASCVPP